jgi:hypothetical protein
MAQPEPPVNGGPGCPISQLFGTELLIIIINKTPDVCFDSTSSDRVAWHRQRLACVCKAFAQGLEHQVGWGLRSEPGRAPFAIGP